MKTTRFFKGFAAMAMAATLITSCYDDLELRQEIEGLGNEVEQIKTDLAQLKSDLAALKAASEKNLTIVDVKELTDGYELVFSDGSKAVIKNGVDGTDGKDGKDGKDAKAPVVGVAEGEDGNLYWTVDGEWLLVDGEKVRANGADGTDGAAGKPGADAKAPVVTIALDEDGYYYWQIDGEWLLVDGEKVRANGIDGAAGEPGDAPVITVEWSQSNDCYVWRVDGVTLYDQNGKVIPAQGPVGPQGDAFFRSVEFSNDGPKLVISIINPEYPDDPTRDFVYEIPVGVFYISFDAMQATGVTTEAKRFNYTISGVSATDEVIVRVLSTNATVYRVVPEENTNARGYVEVELPSGEGWLDVYAINNTTGDFTARSIKIQGKDFYIDEVSALHFSPAGQSIEFPITTGVEYVVKMTDGGETWLTTDELPRTRAVKYATLKISADANTGATDRMTTVTIRNKDNNEKVYATFTINQKNYYPELISVAGKQVEWEEAFGYYSDEAAVTPVKVGNNQLTYTNTFTISLSDDFTKGAYKINGMFVFKHYIRGLEGGEYYADVEGDKLIVYTDDNAPSRSYYFNSETVELTYDKSQSTLNSMSPIGFGTKFDNGDYINKAGWIGDYSVKVYVPAVEPETPGVTDPIAGTWDLTAGQMGTGSGFGQTDVSLAGKTMIISGSGGNYTIETINGESYNLAVTLNGNTLSAEMNGDLLKLNYDSESNTLTQEGDFINWANPAIRGIVATKQGGALTASDIIDNLVGVNWKQDYSESAMVNKLNKVSFVKVDANHIKINNLFDCVTISSALIDPSAMTLTVSSGWAHPQADPSAVNPELIFNISDDFKTITLSGTHAFGGYMSVTDYVLSKES